MWLSVSDIAMSYDYSLYAGPLDSFHSDREPTALHCTSLPSTAMHYSKYQHMSRYHKLSLVFGTELRVTHLVLEPVTSIKVMAVTLN